MTIELGSRVRDQLTGFIGRAVSRVEYITGCVQYCVLPGVDQNGKMPEGVYIDEQRLEVIDGPIACASSPTGGDMRDCPAY